MNAHERAKEYWQQQPLFLDTQTTGLGPNDEVVQVAVVDWWGRVLLDTLVKPTIPIPPAASAIHGITDDMVADAPTFKQIAPALKGLLEFQTVVIYNADYDLRILRQTAAAHGLEGTGPFGQAVCAMLLYAEYAGERSLQGLPRWWKLSDAAANCGIQVVGKHTAAGDANTTRLLLQHMAANMQPVREKIFPTEAGDVYVDPDQLEESLAALMTLWGKRRRELDHIEERICQDIMAFGADRREGDVQASLTYGRRTYDYQGTAEKALKEGMSGAAEAFAENEETTYDYRAICLKLGIDAPVLSQSEPGVTIGFVE